MELSFLQFAMGFVVNYKHSDIIQSGKGLLRQVIWTELGQHQEEEGCTQTISQ